MMVSTVVCGYVFNNFDSTNIFGVKPVYVMHAGEEVD
jgi:hypothetical protein